MPRFVAELAERLVGDYGIEVKVIAPHEGGLPKKVKLRGVSIERFQYTLNPARQCVAYNNGIPDNLRASRRARWQLPAFCASMSLAVFNSLAGSDLIHAHWIEPALLAMLANVFHGRPLVLTVHSLPVKLTALHRLALRRAERVVFNSRYTMGRAADEGARCRGQVIHQGYDDRLFGKTGCSGEMRRRLGIPPQAIVVTSVGRMIELKGMHVLAEASTEILKNRPEAHLVLAGDGPWRERVAAVVRRLAVENRICLPGPLSPSEVAELLADSQLFVNPGIVDSAGRAEAFGIATTEAMASGLACVGTRVGGLGEVIDDGVTGLLIEPIEPKALAAAVGRLLDDEPLRARMGEAGRARAIERFSWCKAAEKFAELYGEVLEEKHARKSTRGKS